MPLGRARFSWVSACCLCVLATVNVAYLLAAYRGSKALVRDKKTFSYIGDDFPEYYISSREIPDVLMSLEEARAYPIHGDDALERWASSTAKGFGYVRLGPEHRAFAISMFHQLHCMRLLRSALSGRYDDYTRGHTQHCLNYLRQMILCSPDLTLKPFDVLDRDFEVKRHGSTHTCPDWGVLYEEMVDNWQDWVEARNRTVSN